MPGIWRNYFSHRDVNLRLQSLRPDTRKTDARSISKSYSYDALHRETHVYIPMAIQLSLQLTISLLVWALVHVRTLAIVPA